MVSGGKEYISGCAWDKGSKENDEIAPPDMKLMNLSFARNICPFLRQFLILSASNCLVKENGISSGDSIPTTPPFLAFQVACRNDNTSSQFAPPF